MEHNVQVKYLEKLWCWYNCNKWVMNLYGGSDAGIAGPGFDVLKLFHLYKPNYSWVSKQTADNKMEIEILPYQVTAGDTGTVHILGRVEKHYWYRPADIDGGTSGTNYSGSSTEPALYIDVGNYGDSG